MEQGHMVHRLSRLGGIRISRNHRELENSTVLKYLRGGQILALMLEHWGTHKLFLSSSEEGHLYAIEPTEPVFAASYHAVAKVLLVGLEREVYWIGRVKKTKHVWTDNVDFLSSSGALMRSVWKIETGKARNRSVCNLLDLIWIMLWSLQHLYGMHE